VNVVLSYSFCIIHDVEQICKREVIQIFSILINQAAPGERDREPPAKLMMTNAQTQAGSLYHARACGFNERKDENNVV
jgi:hypothetical protein